MKTKALRLSNHLTMRRTGLLCVVVLLILTAPGMVAAQRPEVDARKANRLAQETSPYLLQHAHNPVDWYPWGNEALERAKRENKIIFLSIGYSSCHWCHVMERESFMDQQIADFLNKHFVCIKVDREERPDIDSVYMTSLQTFYRAVGAGQGGGWPLTMFLTPDAEPFFGGTYFPPRDGDRGRATGLLTLLQRVAETWNDKEDLIRGDAKTLTRLVKAELERQLPPLGTKLERQLLDDALLALSQQFDSRYGGFGFDPADAQQSKFPEPPNLLFLVECLRSPALVTKKTEPDAQTMLITTLDHVARGGIYDHLGGGFHRYSVDRYWSIPHFEKMLYDNGQLLSVYSEAYALTGRADFRRVVEQCIGFTLREMADPGGGFYSALDADSEGEEGKFYRWESGELEQVITKDQWQPFASVYQLDGEPNFEEKFFVPQVDRPWSELAGNLGLEEQALIDRLSPVREDLLRHRNQRVRPATDTKVLTAWNGLMIRGLADAGRLLNEPSYVESAGRCAEFLLTTMRKEDGRLLCTYSQGQARLNAYLNDYAFLVDGLIALHRATGDAKWLEAAQQLTDKQIELFWDEKGKGFYFTSDDHETLLARTKDLIDNVIPSGNSVAATNLLYLAEQLKREDFRQKADETIHAALPYLERSPAVSPWMLIAVARSLES
jgi:uncharacterized protein YyaL (SSP411 family)